MKSRSALSPALKKKRWNLEARWAPRLKTQSRRSKLRYAVLFWSKKTPTEKVCKKQHQNGENTTFLSFTSLLHTKHCTCQSFYLIDRIEPYLCSEKVCKGNISWCSLPKILGFKTMDEEWLWLQWQSKEKNGRRKYTKIITETRATNFGAVSKTLPGNGWARSGK